VTTSLPLKRLLTVLGFAVLPLAVPAINPPPLPRLPTAPAPVRRIAAASPYSGPGHDDPAGGQRSPI
jgi:hypothetical protein